MLDPEFLPLLRELHEIELLRSIEPRITEMKKKMRGKIEGSSVFVSGLHESVSPAHLYEALCHIFEMRKITFSPNNRTAHLHFENRGDAVAAFHEISTERERYQHWGVDLNASLVKSLLPNELVAVKGEKNLLLDSLRDDSLIEDSAVMSKLVDKLVYSRCPIVCNFNPPNREKSALILEVYTGRHPVIKFILDGDSALKGKLGALLESEVPKVVKRTDTSNVYEAVKICYEAGFVCKNIFGISDGFKIVPYMRAGQSFFKESPHSIQAAAEVLGIDNVTGKKSMDTQLLIYQYLVDTLPSKMLEFWADKCHADLLIGTNTEIPKGKLNRKVLKEKYETYSFHVTCVKGSAERLKSVLEAYLDKNNMTYNHIIVSGQHALVSMHRRNPILREIVSNLNNETDVNGLKLRAKEIKLQPNLNIQNLFDPINEEKLRMKMASHVAKLNGLGVFDGILEPVSDSKRTEFDLANRNLDQYRSLTR